MDYRNLADKAHWVRRETLRLHKLAPGTRIASSLSPVEIFTVLYYGGILRFDPKNVFSEDRDRVIVSKAHGSVSLYPILADLGFFDKSELDRICQDGTFLGSIPDPAVPGYETMNGSLGYGIGVGCGMAIALREKKSQGLVFVVIGDGELYEGSVWESIMFASHHRLGNVIVIVDNNKLCMLDYCKNIVDLEPFEEKFRCFGWKASTVDGHDVKGLYAALTGFKNDSGGPPKVLIANTVKGKGVPRLERDPLCHIKSLAADEVDDILKGLQ